MYAFCIRQLRARAVDLVGLARPVERRLFPRLSYVRPEMVTSQLTNLKFPAMTERSDLEKKLIANRWILEGIYDFSPASVRSEQYCVFKPEKTVIIRFAENGTLTVYFGGKEHFRGRYKCTKRFLIIDGPWIGPCKGAPQEKIVFLIGTQEKTVWLMIVNDGKIDKLNLPISIQLIPDVS